MGVMISIIKHKTQIILLQSANINTIPLKKMSKERYKIIQIRVIILEGKQIKNME